MDRSPLLLCLLLVVGAPSACRAQADPDLCAQCRDNANTFFEAVQQPDEVREQADLLRAVVCPLVSKTVASDGRLTNSHAINSVLKSPFLFYSSDGPATEYCDQLVDRHWGRILKAVALDDVTINGFCFGLGQCDIKTGVRLHERSLKPCSGARPTRIYCVLIGPAAPVRRLPGLFGRGRRSPERGLHPILCRRYSQERRILRGRRRVAR